MEWNVATIEPGRIHRDPGQYAHDEVNAEDSLPRNVPN
jgi:hypothetical protein